MKKSIVMLGLILLVTGCVKEEKDIMPDGKWNGYYRYLKQGEVVHTLWAGQNIDIGTVTHGIDQDARFYVTYDCSSSGWQFSETHMFAGPKADMPLNKPGSPKIGRFPYSTDHSPQVATYTYYVPLSNLPPAEDPGFVVASHCVVHSPGGQCETAWAEGDHTFSDKGWGWYDTYYFNSTQDTSVIIYGTLNVQDTLKIYMIDVVHNTAENIVVEYLYDAQGRFDATAYDEVSNLYFFASYNTGELWINPLGEDAGSFLSGMLIGTPASGTYHDQSYYYVDEDVNTINKVDFDPDWMISTITVLSTIPGSVTVNDITVEPSGSLFYIIGEFDTGETELLTWDPLTDDYYTTSITMDAGAQIAYGDDGNLYALAGIEGGPGVTTYMLENENGVMTPINSGVVIIEDPFSDISRGPSL